MCSYHEVCIRPSQPVCRPGSAQRRGVPATEGAEHYCHSQSPDGRGPQGRQHRIGTGGGHRSRSGLLQRPRRGLQPRRPAASPRGLRRRPRANAPPGKNRVCALHCRSEPLTYRRRGLSSLVPGMGTGASTGSPSGLSGLLSGCRRHPRRPLAGRRSIAINGGSQRSERESPNHSPQNDGDRDKQRIQRVEGHEHKANTTRASHPYLSVFWRHRAGLPDLHRWILSSLLLQRVHIPVHAAEVDFPVVHHW